MTRLARPSPGGWTFRLRGIGLLSASLIAASISSGCSSPAPPAPSAARVPPGNDCLDGPDVRVCWARAYPPAGGAPVTIARGPRGWRLLAWAYRAGHGTQGWCWETVRGRHAEGSDCGTQQLHVWAARNRGFGGFLFPPDDQGVYLPPQPPGPDAGCMATQGESDCWFGTAAVQGPALPLPRGSAIYAIRALVTAAAATVVITYRGHPYSAPVARVPLGHGRWAGAFQVWLRLPQARHSGTAPRSPARPPTAPPAPSSTTTARDHPDQRCTRAGPPHARHRPRHRALLAAERADLVRSARARPRLAGRGQQATSWLADLQGEDLAS